MAWISASSAQSTGTPPLQFSLEKKYKTPLNQPKSRMYEFKTRTYMRTHTFDAYMLSI